MSDPALTPRVLVVDDNHAGRYVLVRTLERGQFTVLEAADGHGALRAALSGPDVIVLDVNLPDISGHEVVRRLKADPATASIPVLMVSAAYLSDWDRAQGLQGGADSYLTQPVEPLVLLATVQALLRVRVAEARLRQANQQLEENVAARTAELAQRNADLEARTAQLAQQKARLEQANADLEAFAYSVSHDLRTPLRHISSFSGLLRRHLTVRADGPTLQYLGTIERSAGKMDMLITALLAFSRFGRDEMQFTDVDLQALTCEVRSELSLEAEGRSVQWVFGDLPVVRGDARLLRLVLLNLLSNALKFTRQRKDTRIEVRCEEHPDRWVVSVKDNGAGFDPRHQSKLFGVFHRLHHESEFEGTGVGLANVKRIVQRHDGHVWAEGRPGDGAVFCFSLAKRGSEVQARTARD